MAKRKNDSGRSYWRCYDPELPVNIMVIGKTFCEPDYFVERKNSSISAFEYIESGSGFLQVNSKKYIPPENSAVILPKGSTHRYYTDKANRWKKRWVVFDSDILMNLADFYLPRSEYCFPDCNLGELFDEIDEIAEKYKDDYASMCDAAAVVLYKMIISIKRAVEDSSADICKKICSDINAAAGGGFCLDDLCAKYGYSKNHIIRIFREKYGVTPYKYYTDKKMRTAKLYLRNTDLTVEEIARRLGFTDAHYFSAYFKSANGISPLGYRKNRA